MELRKKLAELRIKEGLTQDELARELGVTRQAVSKWERGVIAPSTKKLVVLSRLYGVPLDELVSGGPPVAVAEEPETTPPAGGEAPASRGRSIAARIGLAACLVLVTIAAIITIWSAVFKKPEKPENGIIRTEDMEPDYIDPAEVQDWTDTTITIEP